MDSLKLTRRADGRLCKKIGGRIHYFGRDEARARQALLDFLRLHEAISPASHAADRVTVQIVGEAFAARCLERIRLGTMKRSTFDDYDAAIAEFAAVVGPSTRVSQLRADQFGAFRSRLAKRLGSAALDRNVQAIRTLFKWAFDNRVIDALPRYGDQFGKSRASDRGNERSEKREAHGERWFAPAELRKILSHELCRGDLRTFILLGLNAGLYAKDISDLDWREVARVGRRTIIERNREKTSQRQTFPLWPEIAAALEMKRRAKSGPIFTTRYGNRWRREGTDAIGQEFDKLLDAAGVKRHGLGFGALRHTHVSAVAALPDKNAAARVRGHRISGIESHYDFPTIERLAAITDHARRVLLLSNAPRSASWLAKPTSRRA